VSGNAATCWTQAFLGTYLSQALLPRNSRMNRKKERRACRGSSSACMTFADFSSLRSCLTIVRIHHEQQFGLCPRRSRRRRRFLMKLPARDAISSMNPSGSSSEIDDESISSPTSRPAVPFALRRMALPPRCTSIVCVGEFKVMKLRQSVIQFVGYRYICASRLMFAADQVEPTQ